MGGGLRAMFAYGQLTRVAGADPRNLTFAVLDVETTGLYPGKGSRVCEIGIVRMRGDGVILDEYSTLIDPRLRCRVPSYGQVRWRTSGRQSESRRCRLRGNICPRPIVDRPCIFSA
ncbi:exonuclease domain-containing protein [Streptosporangium sp. NPDC006013]|uniref:exonuclease domain-containing protein n=1 Tax=Streptosporangium sp. NPDC006013 TaxID=3155596 RepID=UPI0033AA84EE